MEDLTVINVTPSSSEIGANFSIQPSEATALQFRGALIMLPFVLFAVLANILTILAFLVEKRLRVFYNYFVVNMAIADTLIGITGMGLSMVQFLLTYHWPFGHVSCSLLMTISHMSFHVSILMVLIICIDRWYAVHRPLRHIRLRRRSVALKVNASVWFTALVIWGPFIGIWGLFDPFSQAATVCSPVYFRFALATFGTLVMVYWIPVMMITILYVSLYRDILSSGGAQVSRNFQKENISGLSLSQTLSRNISANATSLGTSAASDHETGEVKTSRSNHEVMTSHSTWEDERNIRSKRNKEEAVKNVTSEARRGTKTGQDGRSSSKAQRTLTLLVVVLVVTLTPYSCVVLALTYCYSITQQNYCLSPLFSVISVCVTWGNSLLNPVMYAAAQPLFRETILKILVGKCRD